MARYAIGIDLGTTNSCCAYIDRYEKVEEGKTGRTIHFLDIPQCIELGEVAERRLLPSFIYIPQKFEITEGSLSLPWEKNIDFAVGELARKRSVSSPQRVVSSAKSWLCNSVIDRKSPVLPWTQTDETMKISPFEASVRILEHIKNAWNYKMAEFEDSDFKDQIIALTVPASFDDVARELTVEAAEKAGYTNISLIEEPQAAFYDWLANHESMWKRELKGLSDILVCDVGGGTTDFTIIRAEEKDGDVFLKRASVGDHLLLGGDNMDMALALKTEKEYLGKKKLDPVMFASLCGECRLAKEKMLEKDGMEKAPITVLGRGSRLINSSIHAELRREDCIFELENGFFPKEEFKISKNLSAGLSEWGLPYQKNPKITAHMADFIKTHMKNGTFPNAVLFNGGVFRSEALRNRLREQLEEWGNGSIRVLENESLDLAVAGGAAYFSNVGIGDGIRIGGGSPRSYYVKIDVAGSDSEDFLCLIPKDLMTESVQEIKNQVFSLRLDYPVSFSIFSSNKRDSDLPGDIISVPSSTLYALPPLFTVLNASERKSGIKLKDVYLKSKLTEIGTLELSCAGFDGNGEWKLKFGIGRNENAENSPESPKAEKVDSSEKNPSSLDSKLLSETLDLISNAFTKKSKGGYKNLLSDIEKIWNLPKSQWNIALNRAIFDALMAISSKRRLDDKSEGVWFNVAGFTIRPGYGFPLDEWRIEKAESLAVKYLQYNKEFQNRFEWWVFWRRCAGGLSGDAQRLIFDRVSPWFLKGKKHIKAFSGPIPSKGEMAEILKMASYFDKIPVNLKLELCEYIMENIFKKEKDFSCQMLKRIVGRKNIYGSYNFIIPPAEAEKIIKAIIESGFHEKSALSAVASMAMLTGDRSRDISEDVRGKAKKFLVDNSASEELIKSLSEIVEEEPASEEVFLGDSVPAGLTLKTRSGNLI